MINMTKMNLYRLFKTKTLYVILLVAFCLITLITTISVDPENIENDRQIMEQSGVEAEEVNGQVGMTTSAITNDTSLDDIFISEIGCGLGLMLVGILVIVYAEEERKSGFLKNLPVSKKEKKNIYLSKLPVAFVISLLMITTIFAACAIGANVSQHFALVNTSGIAKYFIIEVLLHSAYGVFALFFYELFRKSKLAVLLVTGGAFNLIVFFAAITEAKLSDYLSPAFLDRFALSQYMIVTRARGLNLYPAFHNVSSITVAILGIIVYGCIGTLAFCKRDVI